MGDEILPFNNTTQPLQEAPKPHHRLPTGFILEGRYQIDAVVGSGGMGAVYRARDLHFTNIEKWVAVKEMAHQSENQAEYETSRKNFEREANLLAALSHPSIPHIYDYFTHADQSYLVMDFIPGQNLELILKQSPDFLPEAQTLQWAIEMCAVLDYLHTHTPEPVIFRDMKPSNIIIDQHNRVMLVDFGIAKVFKTGQKATVMGTEGYSPPEQYRGELSPLVDIYALGGTLHHMLTGKNPQLEPPFTFTERPIRTYNLNVSSELIQVVEKAVQYVPESRYQTTREMLAALQAIDLSGGAPAQSRLGPTLPPMQSDIQPLWLFECEDEIRGTPVVRNGVVYVGSYDNNLYALDGMTGRFEWKFPTAGAIVGRPVTDDACIYLGSLDGMLYALFTHSHRLVWTVPTGGPICSSPVVWGRTLFVGSDDGFLYAISTETGSRLWRYDTGAPVRSTPAIYRNNVYFGNEAGDFYCLDFFGKQKWHFKAKRALTSSPLIEEQLVVFASIDSGVYAFDARMGWEVWRFRMGKGAISSPCFSDHLIYLGSIDGQIYCIDARSGRGVWTFRTDHQVTGSPLVTDQRLFCGSVDGYFYNLDAKTGSLLWKYQTGGPITGAPAHSEQIVYIGSVDHRLYAFPTWKVLAAAR